MKIPFIRGVAIARKLLFFGVEGCLMPQVAIFGDTGTEQRRTQGAQSSNNNCTSQNSDNPPRRWVKYEEGADAWQNKKSRPNNKKGRAKQHAPQAAPKCLVSPPVHHAIAGIVRADHLLFSLIALALYGQFFRGRYWLLELSNDRFRFDIGIEKT